MADKKQNSHQKKDFSFYFPRYAPDPELRPVTDAAQDIRIRCDREKKIVEITASFGCIFDKNELYAVEDGIKEAYELNIVRLMPRYPGKLFSHAYLPQIITELYRIGSVSRGFFDNYEAYWDGDILEIDVYCCNGGIELLCGANTPELISGIIRSEFGLDYKVEIRQNENWQQNSEDFEQSIIDQEKRFCSDVSAAIARNAEIAAAEAEKAVKNEAGKNDMSKLSRVSTLNPEEHIYRELDNGIVKIGFLTLDISGAKAVFGSEFDLSEPDPIRSLTEPKRNAVVYGVVFNLDSKPLRRSDKTAATFNITDKDASLRVKLIAEQAKTDELMNAVSEGDAVALRGSLRKDDFDKELILNLSDVMKLKSIGRTDDAPEKRVELHLHTQMSTMDSTIPPDEAVKLAKAWGHKAVAITDHGNVQAFPIAMEAAEKIGGIKVIYGMEGYFVDDTARAVYGECDESLDNEFVIFDIETTGLSPLHDKITEIGAVLMQDGEVKSRFSTFVDPERHIPENITALTNITDEMVSGAPKDYEAVKSFLDWAGNRLLIAHNANFDTSFIRRVADDNGIEFSNPYLDTVALSRFINPELQNHRLETLAEYFTMGDFDHHRADADAEMLGLIFSRMCEKLRREGITDLGAMQRVMSDKADPLMLRPHHIIILVKNLTGLKNLYKLVSRSYLDYFYRNPRIPKTLLDEYREGLILGSACQAGEFFSALMDNRSEGDLIKIAKYYDYIEVQPLANNRFLINEGKASGEEDLMKLNRRAIDIADKAGVRVCATCDAHFLNPEDEIFRKIMQAGMRFSDADAESSLYLRTTDEMLREFSYLPEDVAQKIVIENPNAVADEIEEVRPIPKGTFTPKVEGADEELIRICRENAGKLYGDPLPDIVSARMDRELNSIIEHGFAVLYIIAQKLVAYSESLGYLVGSRGSVGSSFVASLAGISEVNPLPPHRRCPKCRYCDFKNEEKVGSGFDLKDKNCPVCGTKLIGDGHDIPFEVFLGFKGDKEPDIDLNFSGDVQAQVHKYTEDLFGAENVFRAGTIGTLADKTAFGFVMKYLEGKGIMTNRAEVDRLVSGCVGVKRTTGQHPGGIVVIPREYEVTDFTPVQHPADDASSGVVTTHFAFSYLHETILKLDELGHDVPTKYKMLEKYTGISVLDTAMNDPDVYALFESPEPLGLTSKDIGCPLGTLGLPEFGTRFVQQVLVDAKPKNFSDLLQVSGITHGTGVWVGNAQDLIKSGTTDLAGAIGTRDSIMLTLIQKYGVEDLMAFRIMEIVRKNKKGAPIPADMVEAMQECGVPEWYIDSCRKIRYMFPKAHAAAYVMSAIRLGWYKVHRPMEFYAAFLSAAPGGFDGEIAGRGRGAVQCVMEDIEKKGNTATAKENELYTTFQLVNEAMARRIKFLPVDLYKSDERYFLPENGAIRMPFNSLPGLGDAAAKAIAETAKANPELSKEELRQKAQISKAVMEILERNGVLKNMSETNQITLF